MQHEFYNTFEQRFSFSKTYCHTKVKGFNLTYYLPITGRRIFGFMPSEMWNADSLVQILNSERQVHFLWQ